MKIIGLTGGIASGKSTISKFFMSKNVVVIDLDVIARQVVEPGRPAYKSIVKVFGPDVLLSSGGAIDRIKLGKIVFENENLRRKLNSITHRYILIEVFRQIFFNYLKGKQVVILDVPLLFETGFHRITSKNIVVYVDEQTQLERLLKRDPQLSKEDAMNRIKAQKSLEEKRKLADFVIDNTGEQEATFKQAELVSKKINPSLLHKIMFNVVLPTVFSLWAFWSYQKVRSWW
eukprot:TRINITY_DN13774_c0_g1_i1.p1 TRINITY_DN13774_c0_g1~~TRINITY_DN13774_c0_g1_i1.p1  ORF type:complete len:231 (+),score=67.39 TRINITY_DN13774_c0_g1_i1:90-782(+)